MADDLRTDLDQLLAQTGQRPPLRRLGHRQRPHEVAEVISQCMEPETNGIGGECSARGSLPFDRARAFLHPLLHRPALVVKGDDALCRARLVGHDEADARVQLARMPFDLGHGAACSSSALDS